MGKSSKQPNNTKSVYTTAWVWNTSSARVKRKKQATDTISELWVRWSSRLQDTSETLCGQWEARFTLRQPSGPPVGPCSCPAPPCNPGPPRSAPNVAVLKHMTVNNCCKGTWQLTFAVKLQFSTWLCWSTWQLTFAVKLQFSTWLCWLKQKYI